MISFSKEKVFLDLSRRTGFEHRFPRDAGAISTGTQRPCTIDPAERSDQETIGGTEREIHQTTAGEVNMGPNFFVCEYGP